MSDHYYAGQLNDYGGGDVDWWWDYLRSEIDRANEFHAEVHGQNEAALAAKDADIARLEAENQDLRTGSYLASVVEERDRLRTALETVANIAGNIPDDILCRATGANDARYRGGIVCSARDIARAALEAKP